MEKQLVTTALIEETRSLVGAIKRNFHKIAINLYKIHRDWTGTADSWVDFYQQDLEIDKATVSRLLGNGQFFVENNISPDIEATYQNLYRARIANKGEDPKKILAIATTWREQDFKDDKKEQCKTPDFQMVCVNCWSTKEKHA